MATRITVLLIALLLVIGPSVLSAFPLLPPTTARTSTRSSLLWSDLEDSSISQYDKDQQALAAWNRDDYPDDKAALEALQAIQDAMLERMQQQGSQQQEQETELDEQEQQEALLQQQEELEDMKEQLKKEESQLWYNDQPSMKQQEPTPDQSFPKIQASPPPQRALEQQPPPAGQVYPSQPTEPKSFPKIETTPPPQRAHLQESMQEYPEGPQPPFPQIEATPPPQRAHQEQHQQQHGHPQWQDNRHQMQQLDRMEQTWQQELPVSQKGRQMSEEQLPRLQEQQQGGDLQKRLASNTEHEHEYQRQLFLQQQQQHPQSLQQQIQSKLYTQDSSYLNPSQFDSPLRSSSVPPPSPARYEPRRNQLPPSPKGGPITNSNVPRRRPPANMGKYLNPNEFDSPITRMVNRAQPPPPTRQSSPLQEPPPGER